jgi:glycosyltransferase involved in cell wall biosynthesis
MKIAIISGHFMPDVGYQEVYLARAFSRLGHQVRVITSNKPSPSAKSLMKSDYAIGLTKNKKFNYSVLRLRAAVKLGTNVISLGLKKALRQFSPDLVVVIAIGKVFPYSVLDGKKDRNHKLVALFGDNIDFWSWSSAVLTLRSLKSIILQKVFKNRIYAKAVRSCDKLYLNTPETESILLSYLPKKIKPVFKEKRVLSNLGFDPDEFFFDTVERKRIRNNLNISPDEVVFITSTRVTKVKNLEKIIDFISKVYAKDYKVRYIIIGFLGDNYEMELKQYIKMQPHPEIFYCYPFLSHEEIRRFYCASDIGIWLRAAISIQEAMGTGLPIILEKKMVMNHLIQEGVNGWYFEKGQLMEVIEKSAAEIKKKNIEQGITDRKNIASTHSLKFSYNNIAQRIIDSFNAF